MSEMNFVFHSVNGKRTANFHIAVSRTAKERQKNGKRAAKGVPLISLVSPSSLLLSHAFFGWLAFVVLLSFF